MAYKIDHIIAWLIAIFSTFFLMLTITDGNILLSLVAAFIALSLLRILTQRFLSGQPYISRSKRIKKIHQLLYKWITMEDKEVFQQLQTMIPGYFPSCEFVLVRRIPTNGEFSANDLLELWSHYKKDGCLQLRVLVTCPMSKEARYLLKHLAFPEIAVTDGTDLTRELLKNFRNLPKYFIENTKKEQCVPIRDRITLFVQAVRPFRLCMYLCFFTGMYLMTRSTFYLLSFIAVMLLLTAHTVANRLYIR